MNRRASCVGIFEVFEAAHVALRTLLAFSQPVNCIFWPIGMLNWLVAASKLHKHRETCCTAEWPFYSFLILWPYCLCLYSMIVKCFFVSKKILFKPKIDSKKNYLLHHGRQRNIRIRILLRFYCKNDAI